MSKKVEVNFDGKTYWYDQEQEKALTKYMEDQKRIVEGPMITALKEWMDSNKDEDYYDAKLLTELMNYPESVREEFGVTTARHGEIKKESMVERITPMQNQLNDLHFKMQQHLFKYPITPDQAFPKPGELYECGKQEPIPEYKPFKWYEPPGYKKFSERMGFVDMAKDGQFQEYIGTYKRKMLLLL